MNIFPSWEKKASPAKTTGPFTSITVIFSGFPSIGVCQKMIRHAAARYTSAHNQENTKTKNMF